MTIKVLGKTVAGQISRQIATNKVATVRNGVGAYVLPCTRMEFHYCDYAGSSRGMNIFLEHRLASFARSHPSISITVSPVPSKHPTITGYYVNGRHKCICVKNLEPNSVLMKAELLRHSTGEKNRRSLKTVISQNESVRGIWSPLHGEGRDAANVVGLVGNKHA